MRKIASPRGERGEHNALKLAMKCKSPFSKIQKLANQVVQEVRITLANPCSIEGGGGECALLKKATPALLQLQSMYVLLYYELSTGLNWIRLEVGGGGGGGVCCFTTFCKARKRRCCKVVANKLK